MRPYEDHSKCRIETEDSRRSSAFVNYRTMMIKNQKSFVVIIATIAVLVLYQGDGVFGVENITKKVVHFSFITALSGGSISSGGITEIIFVAS